MLKLCVHDPMSVDCLALQVLAAWKVLVDTLASQAPHMLARVVVQARNLFY